MDISSATIKQTARQHLVQHFAAQGAVYGSSGENRELLVAHKGDGPYVIDVDGKRYIDALSSLYCAQIGYSYGAEFAEAISEQLNQLPFHTNWSTAHVKAVELAEALAQRAPANLNHLFFTNGGSESVESAWKIVREYFQAKGQPARLKAIARNIAYHGVTLGALSFTGVPAYKEAFGQPAIDVTHVANTNRFRRPDGETDEQFCQLLLDEVRQTILNEGPETVALLIAEPVQNAGGCLVPPAGYWQGLRQICDEFGILLAADSVICGFGRLGNWLGIEHEDVRVDLVTTAKGITSAYAPMGAVFVDDHVYETLSQDQALLRHGITFGGHPISCAAALKNIEIFEREKVFDNVNQLAPKLNSMLEGLTDLPIVGQVRGAGFFWAIELVAGDKLDSDGYPLRFTKEERDSLLRGYMPEKLREVGLIARADDRGDSVLQIAPPLISDEALLGDITDRLRQVLEGAGKHIL